MSELEIISFICIFFVTDGTAEAVLACRAKPGQLAGDGGSLARSARTLGQANRAVFTDTLDCPENKCLYV